MSGRGARVHIEETWHKILSAERYASIDKLGEAGQLIMRLARASIITTKKTPSAPGRPPHTRQGKLRKAILYAVERSAFNVVVGPSAAVFATIGEVHEYGGKLSKRYYNRRLYLGNAPSTAKEGQVGSKASRIATYPARPFMQPALDAAQPKIPLLWRDSIIA